MAGLTTETDGDTTRTVVTLDLPPYGSRSVTLQRRGDDETALLRAKAELLDWAVAQANEQSN